METIDTALYASVPTRFHSFYLDNSVDRKERRATAAMKRIQDMDGKTTKILVGLSVCHKIERFAKKKGQTIAAGRLDVHPDLELTFLNDLQQVWIQQVSETQVKDAEGNVVARFALPTYVTDMNMTLTDILRSHLYARSKKVVEILHEHE